MAAVGLLSISARGNQPFTRITQQRCTKQCCPAVRNSTRRGKIICGSTAKHSAGRPERAPGNGLHFADQPVLGSTEQQTTQHRGSSASIVALPLALGSILLQSAPAIAFTIHQEPENALSFPTWVIHISSVIEWAVAMSLVWKYAEVTGTAKFTISLLGIFTSLNGCHLHCKSLESLCAPNANLLVFGALLMLLYCVYSLLCLCQLQVDSILFFCSFR